MICTLHGNGSSSSCLHCIPLFNKRLLIVLCSIYKSNLTERPATLTNQEGLI